MKLRNKDKERLIAIFETVQISLDVWAFGSRVNGKAHEGSDLDLAIRTTDLQPVPLEIFGNLKEKIRESHIPIVVELFDWARLPKNFHQNIEAGHEVLYSNKELMLNEPPASYKKARKEK